MPKPVKFIFNSEASRRHAIGEISSLWREHKYCRVTVSFGKDRSLMQNALIHKWFGEISEQMGEHTPQDVKVICKRMFFIPVLRAESDEFNALCNKVLDLGMDEPTKMYWVDIMPVTSICTVKQMSKGMDDMFMYYTDRGVDLTTPSEEGL